MKCLPNRKHPLLNLARLVRLCLVAGSALVGVMVHTAYNGNQRETTSAPLRVSRKNPEIVSDGGKWPRLAWLMSFPNSGTSFTIKMVRHLSHVSTATNYGKEYLVNGESVPVHPDFASSSPSHPPFWADPQAGFDFERPTELAFTKTHCGGYRADSPREELTDAQEFLKKCLSGRSVFKANGESLREPSSQQYSVELVQRAVHLIRNPFDNVVSRFHLQLKRFAKDNDKKQLSEYPKSREGFRKFCRDDNLAHHDDGPGLMDSTTWSLLRDVPCYDDFVRFLQWHNMAFTTTQSLGIPTLVVHYENYETKYNETATEILNFLQLERKGDMKEFIQGKEYTEYFSMEERENAKQILEKVASPVTWEHVSHYFE